MKQDGKCRCSEYANEDICNQCKSYSGCRIRFPAVLIDMYIAECDSFEPILQQ